MKFTINKEKHIDYIINNFDFARVRLVMYNLGWTWFDDSINTPSIERLKDAARELLEDVYDTDIEEFTSTSSGGFKATKLDDFLSLEFIIANKESDELNYSDEYTKLKKNKERINKINRINKIDNNENS